MKLLCVLLFDKEQKFAVDWCTSDSKNIKPYKTRVYLKTVLRSPHNFFPSEQVDLAGQTAKHDTRALNATTSAKHVKKN